MTAVLGTIPGVVSVPRAGTIYTPIPPIGWVTNADVTFLLSTSAGPGGTNMASPGQCHGGFAATPGDLNDLFSDIDGEANAARRVDFACMFVFNGHASAGMFNVTLFVEPTSAVVAIAADPTPPSPLGSTSPQAVTTNGVTSPAGVSGWVSPPPPPTLTTRSWGEQEWQQSQPPVLSLPEPIPAQYVKGIWIKRTATHCVGPVRGGGFQLGGGWDTG